MGMNIKNEETHRLAREVAALTGESLTEAVTVALRERLERLIPQQASEADQKYARIMALIDEMAPMMVGAPSSTEIGDLLYDEETGLPK
jgi:antitoxin VapB